MRLPIAELFEKHLFELGGRPVTMATFAVVGVIIVVAIAMSRVAQALLRRALSKRGAGEARQVRSFERLVNYAILLVAIVVSLETAGINLSAVVAATAVFAVGIGLALQSVAVNFVSGIILLVERSIKIDDIIEFEGHVCRVMELGVRATRVRTLFEEDIILPNSALVQQPIKNLTLHDSLMRISVTVGVAYEADLAAVRQALEQVAASHRDADPAYAPVVLLADFAASSINYEVSVWVHDPWSHRRHRSMLREAIFGVFRERRIVMAFPQMDVHLDRSVTEAFSRIGRAA